MSRSVIPRCLFQTLGLLLGDNSCFEHCVVAERLNLHCRARLDGPVVARGMPRRFPIDRGRNFSAERMGRVEALQWYHLLHAVSPPVARYSPQFDGDMNFFRSGCASLMSPKASGFDNPTQIGRIIAVDITTGHRISAARFQFQAVGTPALPPGTVRGPHAERSSGS